ncbi:glutamate racemase [Clostridium tunisiense]|uniref:glutamate racemase n=1 Tax=Clostridium tunisiense TaxID=219748 RepID=UPI0002E30FC7|nr:glutamate racemase [Clostridium tunisiense]
MDKKSLSIGFFDSGVGGLSVLRETIKLMPNENYIYFGDSKNAPYGVKTVEEVQKLTFNAVEFLLSEGVKAIVIACNTATSAAIEELRSFYKDIPIIGIEPALKPAVELNREGAVVIMATSMTLAEKKFNALQEKYKEEANIAPLPCGGLVELIEGGNVEGEPVENYLREKFKEVKSHRVGAVVLGCTHYPFVKGAISKVLGEDIPVIDGSDGTSRHLKKVLEDNNLLNPHGSKGTVSIYNSLDSEAIISLSYKLLNL